MFKGPENPFAQSVELGSYINMRLSGKVENGLFVWPLRIHFVTVVLFCLFAVH